MIKLQIKKDQNVYFTSDTHYNHKNICKGISEWEKGRLNRTRDFSRLSEMNNTIIYNINKTVGEDDILFHFGDWSFGGLEQIWEFRKQINCKNIYLFLGNHDEKIIANKILPNVWSDHMENFQDGPNPNTYGDSRDEMFNVNAQALFTWCGYYEEFELIFPQESKNQKKNRFKFVGMHYPIASWDKMGRGMIHIHGHLHLNQREKIHQGRSMDVGVDGNNFKPYSLKEIQRLMKDKPNKFTTLKVDHHSAIKNVFRIFK